MLFTNLSALPWLMLAFVLLGGAAVFTYFRKEILLKKMLSPSVRERLKQSFLPWVRPLKLTLILVALGSLLTALLDPRARSFGADVRLQGIDLVLVYDVSRSMDVRDVAPSRLEAAKAAGEKLADGLAGNRIALIAFAADAYRMLPLTTDIDAVKLFLSDLNTGLISSQSTDIGKALEESARAFSEDTLTHRAVVLFTDGENLDGDPAQGVDALNKLGSSLFIVGAGTAEGGPIPIYEGGREAGVLRDLLGKEVLSKADIGAMQSLARKGEGAYFSLEQSAAIAERINLLQKSSFGTKSQSFLEPKFRVFALGAMIALLFFLFLPERRRALIILLWAMPLYGLNTERKAYESYKNEDFPSALRYYQRDLLKNPQKEKSKFGESAALYKMERSERAEAGFLGLTNSPSRKRSISALFNAGNAQVQGGKFNEALESYGEILKTLPPSDRLYKKAANNYLYVLQQQNQNQQSQQNQQQNRQGQQEQQNQKNQQDQESQDQQDQQNRQGQQNQEDQTPSRPISPKEVENLLGVAQAAEKESLKRHGEKKGRGVFRKDKY